MNTRTDAVKLRDKSGRKKVTFPAGKTIALTDEVIIRNEKKAFEQKKEEYIKKFESKYIALLNGEV